MWRELHDDDSEVRAAEIEGQKLALLLTVRQVPHVRREAFYTRRLVLLLAQSFLETGNKNKALATFF